MLACYLPALLEVRMRAIVLAGFGLHPTEVDRTSHWCNGARSCGKSGPSLIDKRRYGITGTAPLRKTSVPKGKRETLAVSKYPKRSSGLLEQRTRPLSSPSLNHSGRA